MSLGLLIFSSVQIALGPSGAFLAGLSAAAAIYLIRVRADFKLSAQLLAVDFLTVAILASLVDGDGVLWRAPNTLLNLCQFSPIGGVSAVLVYVFGIIALRARSQFALRFGLAVIPFLFSFLIALGAPPIAQLGKIFFLGFNAPEGLTSLIGRTLILFLLNEAVVVGVPLALGRFQPQEWRPHGILLISAFLASLTPVIASAETLFITLFLPYPLTALLAVGLGALAQAGLWGQTYLVTQALAGLLRATPSLSVVVFNDWRIGAEKGAVYGLVFMAVVLGIGLIVRHPEVVALIQMGGPVAAAFIGAATYPLARVIMESTDSTPPFFGRLKEAYLRPVNFARGSIIGAAVAIAVTGGLPAADPLYRFAFGALTGAFAYAGVDGAFDIAALLQKRRQHLRSWRVYTLGAALGGFVAGAIAWYLDQGQLETIIQKFYAYASLDYRADGLSINAYIIRPLFSKWGATDLGYVDGSVRLLYDESLSGVIQWVFAAPLFSINLFFLTALMQRSLKPLRQLASLEGLDLLIENAVRVLRWGLWMAPVIYSFLKAAPDPTWYNQDGLIRTAVASWMNYYLPDNEFRAWSLDIFTALLAYDVLRVLIWFDHMGLRVATLVNLSFVGGDMLDERAAAFLGKEQTSRAIPEGIRRFGTWAPLLLPFYIPRGDQWDKAWSAAEQLSQTRPPSYAYLFGGYLIYAAILSLSLIGFLLLRLARAQKTPSEGIAGSGGVPGSTPLKLTNGLITSEWFQDGQGTIRIEGVARGGPAIDLTRRPDDPTHPRGRFLFLKEESEALWSLGQAPTHQGAYESSLSDIGENCLLFKAKHNGIALEARISLIADEAVEITNLKVINLENRPRKILIATLREWVLNETGVELRDASYNALHVGTWYVNALNAIFAQNRLLKGGARRGKDRRLSPEIGFHAIGAHDSANVTILGYEDVKSRFYGMGALHAPDSLLGLISPRKPEDEGLLYGFEPCASIQLEVSLAASSLAELIIVDGWASNMGLATAAVSKYLAKDAISPETLNHALSRQRNLIMPPAPKDYRYQFAGDGRSLSVEIGTPRPYAHVIANSLGQGAVMTNDGDIFSFHGNSRLNSFSPFRMGDGRSAPAGQMFYVYDLAKGIAYSPSFTPLRRHDSVYDVTFSPGMACYRSNKDELEIELSVFVAPDAPIEFKLLKIRNNSSIPRLLQIVPAIEIILAETPSESLGAITSRVEDDLKAIYFQNPSNKFVNGWAFVATSLSAEHAETSRRRFLGHENRTSHIPYMVEHGHPDAGAPEQQRKIAAFCGAIDAQPGQDYNIVIALGQTDTYEQAQQLAVRAKNADYAIQILQESQTTWDKQLSVLRIKTNQPDFDRLVNDVLPYQLFAALLWGRTGPSKRSGATGYRDQLQDVIPLIALSPERAKTQILLHARHQYLEGDACKWWHRAPNGGTGLADRTHSSDPHLWLPYVTLKYIQGTGDQGILSEIEPFLEANQVPFGQEGEATVPLISRDRDTILGHCIRAIDYSLGRFGSHDLPLVGSGDWDDGMHLVGAEGKGESVWLGFFLHGILLDIAPLIETRGDHQRARRYIDRARKLRLALEKCWTGDRYIRDFADSGRAINPMSAMTSSWPVLSNAVDSSRGIETINNALSVLGRANRILLVSPAYNEHSDPYPGRSAEYPPGVRENGGQYSHGVSWFVDALSKLAVEAREKGELEKSRELFSQAYETWVAISPLSKFNSPAEADIYGLPPHQQAADIYEGPGYEGHGGWSWYTGAAARMLSAAYAVLGIEIINGELQLRVDSFEPKGGLKLERVDFKGKRFSA
ncbi:MAG: GH36-type glycosyl hydrolase domain-containing protein [Methylocystis sp.]